MTTNVSAGTGLSLLLLVRLPVAASAVPAVGGVGLALDSASCLPLRLSPLLCGSFLGGGLATVTPIVAPASSLPIPNDQLKIIASFLFLYSIFSNTISCNVILLPYIYSFSLYLGSLSMFVLGFGVCTYSLKFGFI
jgi:hypothetical protein